MVVASPVVAQAPRPDRLAFRDPYRELVETDTSVATGGCILAAEKVAPRLKAAGFADDQITLFRDGKFPLDGGLVAVLRGSARGRR